MKLICPICGKKIIHKNNKQKYCPKKCAEIAQKEHRKIWRKINKNKINQQVKKYYLSHKEKIKKYQKKYRKEHQKDRKKYRKLHKKEYNYQQKNRLKIDINFKLGKNLRKRIWKALKGINKSQSTMNLIGCSISFLKKYLKKKFKKGMTWQNYGYYGWHIDHIKPCYKFDLSKINEQKKCFHYTNLQPLWAKENLSKNKNG